MNDRELLESAAKAAGFDTIIEMYGLNDIGEPLLDANDPPTVWNPLTDDGDALRLAVKLRLKILHAHRWSDDVEVAQVTDLNLPACEEEIHSDPYAATRRAIVRAAAEIGRSME